VKVQKRSSADAKIGVRLETHKKFLAFAERTRLKLVDIADLAIDALNREHTKTRRPKTGAT
jgi:hypothetical protein